VPVGGDNITKDVGKNGGSSPSPCLHKQTRHDKVGGNLPHRRKGFLVHEMRVTLS
jgi:hypothetical protein